MEKKNPLFDHWVSIHYVKEFFNYKETQLKSLIKKYNIQVSKIGNRRFINKATLEEILRNNIQ
jgi:hypothetical protein